MTGYPADDYPFLRIRRVGAGQHQAPRTYRALGPADQDKLLYTALGATAPWRNSKGEGRGGGYPTWVVGGGVSLGDGAADVEVLEEGQARGAPQVGGCPDEALRPADGDSGLAGLHHHDHGIDVRDGDTRVLAETPGRYTDTHTQRIRRRVKCDLCMRVCSQYWEQPRVLVWICHDSYWQRDMGLPTPVHTREGSLTVESNKYLHAINTLLQTSDIDTRQ